MRYCMVVALLFGICLVASAADVPAYIWREAESADKANFDLTTSPGPHPELLSGGKWLAKELKPEEMEPGAEPDCELTYRIQAPRTDTYRFWLRAGWEFVRAPLRWRIDGGAWQTLAPTQLSRDMIELSFWTEIGWLDGGAVPLTAGPHTLEIWATEWNISTSVEKGKKVVNKTFRLALDCLALVAGDWLPSANLKPGEQPNSPADVEAAKQVFTLPDAQGPGVRTEVSLTGRWQVCRDDDMHMAADPYGPQKTLPPPEHQVWRSCFIPANQWQPLPAANAYAHRVWYRTRVQVPAGYAGRSFLLHFFGTNWIASVVVNGQYIGYHKSVRVPWDIDISAAVKPGQVNEICVGIKDLWYGIDNAQGLDKSRNIPLSFVEKFCKMVGPFFPSTKGDANGTVCGITDWVNLIAAGPVYTANVAIRPSVKTQSLTVVATVCNPTATDATVSIGTEALLTSSGQVEHRIPPIEATIPAGGQREVTLSAPWTNPKLWWPGLDPAPIYQLRTTLTRNGTPLDIFDHEQTFGFREVTTDGIYLRINGLRYNAWNLGGGLHGGTEAEMLAHFRAGNNRFERFGDDLHLRDKLGPRCYQLDWTDKHGIPGRLGTEIDGMSIAYNLRNPVTWDNFVEQVDQMTRAYRNHPSVICYSLENELLLINGRLGTGGAMPMVEQNAKRFQDTAHANDPTRPCMLDGAGALKDNYMDICNTHYAEDGFFPDNARPLGDIAVGAPGVTADPNARGAHASEFAGLWSWDHLRPYCAGEIAYFSGDNTDHAWIGGESAAQDRTQAFHAYGKYVRYLLERYRWNDVAMIFPWVSATDEMVTGMAPLAAFTREYNTTFFGGKPATRTVKVFNDTFSTEPVTFTWHLEIAGKPVAGTTQALTIAPGFGKEVPLTFTPPPVTARTPALLRLEVTQPGSPAFADTKTYAIFPAPMVKLAHPVYLLGDDAAMRERLTGLGARVKSITALAEAPAGSLVLIPPRYPKSLPRVTEFVHGGGRVICLEQQTPFTGTLTPGPLTPAKSAPTACWVFPSGLQTPLFAGLAESDFSNWAGFTPTTAGLWNLPADLSVPRLLSGPNLGQCALVEQQCGGGLLLASQMAIAEKWAAEPAAQTLLANMLTVADGYQAPAGRASVFVEKRSGINGFLHAIGCAQNEEYSLEQALRHAKETPVIVMQGNHGNLRALLGQQDVVAQYYADGGTILLWGLEPEALPAFNALMGTQHVMREFRCERVCLLRDPLLAGASNTDVSFFSKEMLAPWEDMHRVSEKTFTACLDAGDDIAPFCFGPYNPNYQFGDGGGALALVNGLTDQDFWKYIDQGWKPKPSEPFVVFHLPAPCALDHIAIWNNANYDTIKDLDILVDGKKAASTVLPDGYGAVEVPLNGLAATQTVSLLVESTYHNGSMIGLDRVTITRQTPAWARDRVVPLTDTGGLVRYPRGKGGLVLSLLNIGVGDPDADTNRKLHVISAMLHNLGVAFDQTPHHEDGPDAELSPGGPGE